MIALSIIVMFCSSYLVKFYINNIIFCNHFLSLFFFHLFDILIFLKILFKLQIHWLIIE